MKKAFDALKNLRNALHELAEELSYRASWDAASGRTPDQALSALRTGLAQAYAQLTGLPALLTDVQKVISSKIDLPP